MRRKSFISFVLAAILASLSAPCLAQTTRTVIPDSTVSGSPAPDSTALPSTTPGPTASRSTASVLSDPNSTPAEKRAAVAEIRAAAAEKRAALAATRAHFDAVRESVKKLNELEPTTFTPDHETLNKFSYRAMFQLDAFAALNQALAIQSRTTRPTITADETAMFQSFHSGQTGKYTFAEAALIASGVSNAAKRKQYLAKIGQIVAAAKQETDKRTRIEAKADAICSYLFAGPMKADGYDDDAFSLGQVLDDGHYNCVSSCVMFVVVAHGVGLEAGAVVEPGHIVARVPGYDVQTTSGRIFSSTLRLQDIQDDMKKYHEPIGKFDPDHPYHEVRDFGILFEIYQNIANHARDAKQSDQAAIGALKEVFFDPTMPCAGQDLKVYLNDWFNASTTSRDATTAAAIAQLYRKMARDPELADDMDKCVTNLKRQLAKH